MLRLRHASHLGTLLNFTTFILRTVTSVLGAQALYVLCNSAILFSGLLTWMDACRRMNEKNGVVLGIYFMTLPTRAHWPAG